MASKPQVFTMDDAIKITLAEIKRGEAEKTAKAQLKNGAGAESATSTVKDAEPAQLEDQSKATENSS
ncbi:hypothetical protein BJ165DRAFT_1486836 [Panaeolus papilionaceus]|nr:hypothetical protein BJ165DRAFT_1486836 [Panaeolus papilionaceus]